MKVKTSKKKTGVKRNFSTMKNVSEDNEEEIGDSESEVNSVGNYEMNSKRKLIRNDNNIVNSSSNNQSNVRTGLRNKNIRRVIEDEDSDEDNQDSDF